MYVQCVRHVGIWNVCVICNMKCTCNMEYETYVQCIIWNVCVIYNVKCVSCAKWHVSAHHECIYHVYMVITCDTSNASDHTWSPYIHDIYIHMIYTFIVYIIVYITIYTWYIQWMYISFDHHIYMIYTYIMYIRWSRVIHQMHPHTCDKCLRSNVLTC